MSQKNSTTVISLCSLDHADVWKLTSKLLPRFIAADRYVVYVPDNQVAKFHEITDVKIEVLSEDLLGIAYGEKLRQKISSCGNLKRFRWYLQQFYKIEALLTAKSQNIVIWDADCVPVKKLSLFSKDNKPIYMQASQEYNNFYFETIERMLGMKKIQDFSFIIPGFPITNKWINEFAQNFQDTYGINWYDSILENTPFEKMSGFSEYETLGTWIANKYPNSWCKKKVNWERLGQSRFGYAKNFSEEKIIMLGEINNLQVISFENWDHRGFKKFLFSAVNKLSLKSKRLSRTTKLGR